MKKSLYVIFTSLSFLTISIAKGNDSILNINDIKCCKINTMLTNPPTGNASQTFCVGATLSSIQVNGTNIKWYASSSGGSVLSNTTLLVNNTSYFASQTVSGVESTSRLQVTVVVISTPIPTVTLQQNCTSLGTIQLTSPLSVTQTIPTDLFISEFTDSNIGGLSYVEIYNGTGSSINLSNYSIKRASNGGSYSFTLPLNNVNLATGTTYLVALGNNPANACSTSGGDGSLASQTSTDGSVNFAVNGCDHIGLFNGTMLIDSFGVYGNNSWAPTFIGTEGANFRRKNNISPLPNPSYNNNDWDILDYAGNTPADCTNNDYSNIGIYTLNTTVNYQYNVDGGSYQSSTFFLGLAPGTHIVNVQDVSTGCTSSTTITINSNPVVATIPNDYHVCDDNTDGIGIFDLSGVVTPQVLGTTLPAADYAVTYYTSLANAQVGAPVITQVGAFVSSSATIWIKVQNNITGCFDIGTVNLIVDSKPQPTLPTQPYVICDNNQDGISSFNLNTITPDLLQGAPEVYTISYYLNSSDAETGNNSIDLSVPFINSNSPFQQFFWVRAENQVTHCFIVIQIVLDVDPAPIMPTNLSSIVFCDNDNNPYDGCTTFDLESQTPVVLAAQSFSSMNFVVSYYTSQSGAYGGINPIYDAANYYSCGDTTIWVRVENLTTHCFSVGSFHIVAIPRPNDPVLTLLGNVLSSNATTGNQWYDQNGVIVGATGTSFTLPSSGVYGCQVQNGDCWSNIVYYNYTLSNQNFLESSFALYPNPTADYINVVIPSNIVSDNICYTITDITGKIISGDILKAENNLINTSCLENGIYFIIFNDKGENLVKKIVKK
jgi:hypothetical protein